MNRHLVKSAQSVLALVMLGGIDGCMVGPDYHPPQPDVATQFNGTPLLSQRTAQPSFVSMDAWWQGFSDPVLNSIVDTALAQNLTLAQALARTSQAAAYAESAHAQLLPNGQASASASRARQSLEDPVVAAENASLPGFDRTGNLYGAGISSAWEIDLSGGLRRSSHAAIAEYQAAQADVAAARLQVTANVVDHYLLVRLLQARLGVARDQVKTQGDIERLVDVLRSRGLAPDQDAKQASSELSVVRASVPLLEARLTAARNGLDVLLGRTPGTAAPDLDKVAPIPSAPSIEAAGGSAALLRRRPDLIVAERRLAASNERIGQAIAEYYPKVSLSALVGSTTTQGGNLFNGASNEALGALGIRWRLFDFGRVDAQVKAAKGDYAVKLAGYRESVLEATAEVENSISALITGDARAQMLTDGERTRAQARDLVLASYQKGNSSYIDLLETQSRLELIQAERLDASYASSSSAVALYKALGGGWNQPVIE
ncbi:efflux transporter outer membrane subunit [Pseudomonas gingeri]|uniref:efflux transporter outer membrane subunit n=1 Tax=Pseudomonas gingeri TaxID=117681 RepID=UPI00210CE3F4|nr:TolC family protein [Pseudomonas gingeri]